jgi:hypothetical protein
MGKFTKKSDPISERARALTEQITELEEQIRLLSAQQARLEAQDHHHPRLRSTAIPRGPTIAAPASPEPVFEELDQGRLNQEPEPATPEHFNELGVRKYDLPAAWRRLLSHFRGPPAPNPKLVNYLAAGSIQGLRPLRYEKRVARKRFVLFLVILILLVLGLIAAFVRP